ncbi:MAG TPA: class II glutamine amidotransferase [Streptosporangiaceae bacterium]|nr:class II glutamine amidotransferase [Streptosporangiaceae bacterium]
MCRHFGWIGQARTLHELFFEAGYGLPRQARIPRWQRVGLVNRDGFGVGWFRAGGAGNTERYRTTIPIWDDGVFPTLAREVASSCVLGAVRAASPGMPIETNANAPFTNGRCMLSLNGHLNVDKVRPLLGSGGEPESSCDAALLAALLWQRLNAGLNLPEALVSLLRDVVELDPRACLNMLATDGARVVATAWGETLCYRKESAGVLIASEPHDDENGWIGVEDKTAVIADAWDIELHSIPQDGPFSAEVNPAIAPRGMSAEIATNVRSPNERKSIPAELQAAQF